VEVVIVVMVVGCQLSVVSFGDCGMGIIWRLSGIKRSESWVLFNGLKVEVLPFGGVRGGWCCYDYNKRNIYCPGF
jgi:hypothetical protein